MKDHQELRHSRIARSLVATVFLAALTDFQVQLLFVFRAWKRKSHGTNIEQKRHSAHLSRSIEVSDRKTALVICLITLVLAQLILFTIYFSETQLFLASVTSNAQISGASDPGIGADVLLAGTALGACVDTVLALSIVVLLHRRRSDIPFSRTSTMVDRIMMYTVGSGLLTAAFALAAFITMLTKQENIVYVMLLEMLPKRESILWRIFSFL